MLSGRMRMTCGDETYEIGPRRGRAIIPRTCCTRRDGGRGHGRDQLQERRGAVLRGDARRFLGCDAARRRHERTARARIDASVLLHLFSDVHRDVVAGHVDLQRLPQQQVRRPHPAQSRPRRIHAHLQGNHRRLFPGQVPQPGSLARAPRSERASGAAAVGWSTAQIERSVPSASSRRSGTYLANLRDDQTRARYTELSTELEKPSATPGPDRRHYEQAVRGRRDVRRDERRLREVGAAGADVTAGR